MIIRRATVEDVVKIVNIHCSAFNDFFLTSLGIHFLTFYYKCFIKSNETITLVLEKDRKIIGFSASTMISDGFNRRLIISNLSGFCFISLWLLITKPFSLIRLVKNLSKVNNQIEEVPDYAELYSIGIVKSAQGKGYGKILLSELEQYLQDVGIDKLSLTTDYFNNENTLNFYYSMGYNILYDFLAYPNRRMFRLIKIL